MKADKEDGLERTQGRNRAKHRIHACSEPTATMAVFVGRTDVELFCWDYELMNYGKTIMRD